jgi:hypothetical protein
MTPISDGVSGKGGVHIPIRIEDCSARGFASHWFIHDRREIIALLERGVERGNRHNGSCRLDPG